MNSESLISTYQALKSDRNVWEDWWDTLRHYVLPRRSDQQHAQNLSTPQDDHFNQIYDTTAIEACQKLASGHISYITPAHEIWFKWTAPTPFSGNDEIESWYNKASDIALREILASNFYTEIHECFLDRSALGTGSLYCGTNRDGRLFFTHIPCGQFTCAENEEGRVDTYFREFLFSPYQAERMFGKENLGPHCKELLDNPKNLHKKSLRFLHSVSPRPHYDPRRITVKNRPYASTYISLDDNHIVEESGYFEFPYLVTRFLKWGEGPYGLPPGRLVFPAIKQAQFLNRILDTLGEIAAFPRILELADQVGEIDLRAGGRTLISREAAELNFPREWVTSGNYTMGMDRLRQKQDAIKSAFYIPLFEMWSSISHTITATEVQARENEKILMFSPSFTLFTSDFLPIMNRIFGLLYRSGKFPDPPPALLESLDMHGFSPPTPKVIYQSKVAMILNRIQSESLERTLRRLSATTPYAPEISQNFNWNTIIRESARIDGLPEQFLRPQQEIDSTQPSPPPPNPNTLNSLGGLAPLTTPDALNSLRDLGSLTSALGLTNSAQSSPPSSPTPNTLEALPPELLALLNPNSSTPPTNTSPPNPNIPRFLTNPLTSADIPELLNTL